MTLDDPAGVQETALAEHGQGAATETELVETICENKRRRTLSLSGWQRIRVERKSSLEVRRYL